MTTPPKTDLVVLYSTCYRNWEATAPSQLKLLNHLLSPDKTAIIAGHYWAEKWGHDNPIQEPAPASPPTALIAAHPSSSLFTSTPQPSGPDRINYFMMSLRIALANAESLYKQIHGPDSEMPDDQPILRIRPDVVINMESTHHFPHPPTPTHPPANPYYLSMWSTAYRPAFQESAPETGDLIAITTKAAIKRLLSIDLNTSHANIYDPLRRKGRIIQFTEHALYALLEHVGVDIIADKGIYLGIARQNNSIEVMMNYP